MEKPLRKRDWDPKMAGVYVREFGQRALISALRNHCLWAEYDPKGQTDFDKAVLKQMARNGLLSCDDLRKLKLDKIIYRHGREFVDIVPTLPIDVFCDFGSDARVGTKLKQRFKGCRLADLSVNVAAVDTDPFAQTLIHGQLVVLFSDGLALIQMRKGTLCLPENAVVPAFFGIRMVREILGPSGHEFREGGGHGIRRL